MLHASNAGRAAATPTMDVVAYLAALLLSSLVDSNLRILFSSLKLKDHTGSGKTM